MKTKIVVVVSLLYMLGLVAQADEATIGSDADTYVSGSDIMGSKDYMSILGGGADDAGYLRFDLGALGVNTVLDAQLVLRNSPTVDSAGHDERNDGINVDRFALHGLNNVAGNTPQDWDESTLTESSAGAEWTGTVPLDLTGGRVTNLDQEEGIAITEDIVDDPGLDYWVAGNYTITISGQALIDFLQARADDGGLATFIVTSEDTNTKGYGIGTKENATEEFRPVLILTYLAGGPSDPNPYDGQDNVAIDVTLQWNGAKDPNDPNVLDSNVLTHYVYIDFDNTDGDPNLYYDGQVVVSDWSSRAASYGPLSLSLDDSVSWRIEEGMDNGSGVACAPGDPNNLMGSVWNFTALKSIPIVPTNQPASVRAFPPDGAVFTVDFSSISPPTVKWYKDDNTTVTEVTTGITTTDNGGGSYTTTLDLGTPLTVSDEGQYYCSVTNDGGTTYYDSGVADLIVNHLLAQYDFAGTLNDSSGNGAPSGTALDTQGDPNSLLAVPVTINYVTGADATASSAIYLDPNEYVDFSVEGYPKASAVTTNGFGGGMDEGTIVFWVKPNVDVQQVILANFNDGGTAAFMTMLQADQDFDLYIRGTNGTALANHPAARPDRPEYDLTDGKWHMMAACWNGNTSTLYVDGQWVINNTGSTPTSFSAWQRGILLGAARTSADRNILSDMFAGGAVDNLRIYNYRLDDDGVDVFAQEYLDNTGVYPCTNMSFLAGLPSTNFDNTGSSYCIVNLADFVAFASAWLNCGLYPDCP